MKYPERVQEIVETLVAQSGVHHGSPDEERRAVTVKIAQQCRFELGPNWGHKRADPGRPPSTDVFCTRDPFVGWDWSIPSGVAHFPESVDLAGQVFIEVEPVNHLGAQPGPVDPPPPVDGDLEERVTALEQHFEDLRQEVEEFVGRLEASLEGLDSKVTSAKRDIENLIADMTEVEDKLARPLRVEGKTEGTAFHQHKINLEVKRG